MPSIVKGQALRPGQSFGFGLAWFGLGFVFGFGFLVQATHCWPLADMHSDTDKPTTFFQTESNMT